MIREILGCLKETAGAFPVVPLDGDLAQITALINDLAALQRAHRQLLLHLQQAAQAA